MGNDFHAYNCLCNSTCCIIMLGITLVIVSLLIVLAVLYGHQKRETFTNIRGAFPKWTDILGQVRKILDNHFEYDAMRFSEFVDTQAKYSTVTAEEINDFMSKPESKYLPKNFKLNTDVPFDSEMAMYYAKRRLYLEEMRNPTDMSKVLLAYTQYYMNNAAAEQLKSDTIKYILEACSNSGIIIKLKEKTTFSLL